MKKEGLIGVNIRAWSERKQRQQGQKTLPKSIAVKENREKREEAGEENDVKKVSLLFFRLLFVF